MTLRLQLPDSARITLEAHGFASRFQKIRVVISGKGELLQTGDEIIDASCHRTDDLIEARLVFRAHSTRNDAFYVFCDDGADGFALQDVAFEHPAPEHQDILALGSSVHFEITDVFVLRNYLQVDFELFKADSELVALSFDCPVPVQAAQWWTGRQISPAKDSKLTPQMAIGPLSSPTAMERYGSAHGENGHSVRVLFSEFQDFRYVDVATSDSVVRDARLHCRFDDGSTAVLSISPNDTLIDFPELRELVASVEATSADQRPRFLELGGRGEASLQVRTHFAAGFEYCAVDIEAGGNVDVVGDVHELSSFLSVRHYDIVYSHSVLEHLIAPWQVVVEANKVLKIGGYFIAYVPTTWALHAEPWDFWRMSAHAWAGLLNPLTGFEIHAVREIGRAAIVPSTLFASSGNRMQHDPAPLFTCVVARKTTESQVQWQSLGARHASGTYTP